SFLERRATRFNATTMSNFLDGFYRKDPNALNLMRKFLNEEMHTLKLRIECRVRSFRSLEALYDKLRNKQINYHDLTMPDCPSTKVFEYKHSKDFFLSRRSVPSTDPLLAVIAGKRIASMINDPIGFYRVASLLRNEPFAEQRNRAQSILEGIRSWETSKKPEEKAAYQKLNVRQRAKLEFLTNYNEHQKIVDSLLRLPAEGFTTHEVVKNLLLAARITDYAFRIGRKHSSNCILFSESLSSVNEQAAKLLPPGSILPANVYLWTLYAPSSKKPFPGVMDMARSNSQLNPDKMRLFYFQRAYQRGETMESKNVSPELAEAMKFYIHTSLENEMGLEYNLDNERIYGDFETLAHHSWLYEHGIGVPKDLEKSKELSLATATILVKWQQWDLACQRLRWGARKGYKCHMDQLRIMGDEHLARGTQFSAEGKHFEAFQAYKLSASHGNLEGLVRSANCLHTGIGVEKDLKQAEELYKKVPEDILQKWQLKNGIQLELPLKDE
ncbi:MAG TPA: hypothetical protein VMW10_06260, partial [Alphaproteobacteria bacterium]|nr:hypothetical protein [Alphaproteobacteria bacterium]